MFTGILFVPAVMWPAAAADAVPDGNGPLPSWLNVRNVLDYGAKCDVSGAFDSLPAIRAAYEALPDSGGTLLFPCSVGVGGTITIGDGTATRVSSKQNIRIVGQTGAFAETNFAHPTDAGTEIRYIGSVPLDKPLLEINGPISVMLEDIGLQGNNRVQSGLRAMHMLRSVVRNVSLENFRSLDVRVDAYTDESAAYIGAGDNLWENVHTHSTGTAPNAGIDIGFSKRIGDNHFDVARNIFINCSFIVSDNPLSSAIVLRGTDLDTFINTYTSSPGKRSAWGVTIASPENFRYLPTEITFVNSPLVGGVHMDPEWAPQRGGQGGRGLSFYPLAVGDMVAQPGAKPFPTNRYGIHGFGTDGTWFDRYQPLMRRGDAVYQGAVVLYRDHLRKHLGGAGADGIFAAVNLPAEVLGFPDPDASGLRWDRTLAIKVRGSLLQNTQRTQSVRLIVDFGGTTIFDSGATKQVLSAPQERALMFDGTIAAADNSPTEQSVSGKLTIGAPGSAGPTIFAGAATTVVQARDIRVDARLRQPLSARFDFLTTKPQFSINIDYFQVLIQ